MLKVVKIDPAATLPTVAHPGEDIAYDIYALEDVTLHLYETAKVRTGIAAQAYSSRGYLVHGTPLGLLIRDRSSMAAKGIIVSGGVIDHGYTGEISVLLTYNSPSVANPPIYQVKAGDKIAQMIPQAILTGNVLQVEELTPSARGEKGFGSSGR